MSRKRRTKHDTREVEDLLTSTLRRAAAEQARHAEDIADALENDSFARAMVRGMFGGEGVTADGLAQTFRRNAAQLRERAEPPYIPKRKRKRP